MIPIRDTQPSNCFPIVTYSLIAANLIVFGIQLSAGLGNEDYFYLFGLVPAKYSVQNFSKYFSFLNQIFSAFSYMFLHAGFWHFLGNMWSLYIFGDNVEEHFGSLRFLGFYIICGLISAAFHFFLNPVSMVPTIGASGAIAGVMGAYFLLYPGSRILTLIPIIIIPWFIEIPAFLFLGFWFFMQFLNAAGSSTGSGIAWWAHIGGFIAGLVLVKLNKRLPETGVNKTISKFTKKKKTPRLQKLVTSSFNNDVDLIADIEVSSLESLSGVTKLINIPWGFYSRMFKVKIPAGIKQGGKLRLAGLGKARPDSTKGDLYLKVNIKNIL